MYTLKFSDGSIYKGDFVRESNGIFGEFGFLKKDMEFYFTYKENKFQKLICNYIFNIKFLNFY